MKRGFTLVEVLIGLALTGLVVTSLAAAFFALTWLPGRPQDTLTALSDLEQVRAWLTRDAAMAESYTPLSSPSYGRLDWTSRTEASPTTYAVTYYYGGGGLWRQEVVGGVGQDPQSIARNIAQQGDVVFAYSPGTLSLVVSVTSTVEQAGAAPVIQSATYRVLLRPRPEPLVPPPS